MALTEKSSLTSTRVELALRGAQKAGRLASRVTIRLDGTIELEFDRMTEADLLAGLEALEGQDGR